MTKNTPRKGLFVDRLPDGGFNVRLVRIALGGLTALLLVILLSGAFYSVPAGHRAVVFNQMGGVREESMGEGFHFKMPLVESVTKYEVRSQLHVAEAGAASQDLQEVHTSVAVLYHPDPSLVWQIHQSLGPGYAVRVIGPSVQEAVKSVTAKHLATDLIVNRSQVKDEITAAIQERLTKDAILVDQVSITDFDFSPQFNAAIEAKVTAEQSALAAKNKLEQIKFEAQQKVEEAKGQAEAARIVSEQLQQSPQYLEFMALQKWDGVLPMVAGPNGNVFVPFPLGSGTVGARSSPALISNLTAEPVLAVWGAGPLILALTGSAFIAFGCRARRGRY